MGWMNAEASASIPLLNEVLHVRFYLVPVTMVCGVTYGTAPVHKTDMVMKVWSCNPVQIFFFFFFF